MASDRVCGLAKVIIEHRRAMELTDNLGTKQFVTYFLSFVKNLFLYPVGFTTLLVLPYHVATFWGAYLKIDTLSGIKLTRAHIIQALILILPCFSNAKFDFILKA